MKKISSTKIVKDIFCNDLLKISLIRFLLVPILLTTVLYTYVEVNISNLVKKLNYSIQNQEGQIEALKTYTFHLVLVTVLTQLNGFIFTGVVQYIYRNTARCSFRSFINLSPKKFNTLGSGEIQMIIDRKAKAASELIEIFIINLIPICMKLSFVFYYISHHMGYVSGYIMLVSVFMYGSITLGMAIWRAHIRNELNTSENRSSNKLQDALINHETIISCRSTEFEVEKYNEYLMVNENNANKLWRSLYVLNFLQSMTLFIQNTLIIYVGIIGYMSEKITPGDLIFFLSISGTLTFSLSNLGYLYSRYTQAIINARSTYDTIIDEPQENLGSELLQFRDRILFKNIDFGYETKKIFEKINIEIKKGDKVAIIGKNGVGKSTLIKLFLKFESYTGNIYIDDMDINNIKEESFRNLIGYVSQNSFLFKETVKYNIKYGNNNVTDDEIFSLCKKFGLYEAFLNLENGFDTNVGERGKLLSGGERQKILLMRAMLMNKDLLILDEPTAALDKESESLIVKSLIGDEDRTVLMILHNLELLYKFNKIIFINNRNAEVVNISDYYENRVSNIFAEFILNSKNNKV